MAIPERPQEAANSTPKANLTATLADIDRRLEIADENENTIERFFRRDVLLEERDALLADMEALPPTEE